MLFGAAGEGGRPRVHALLTRSTAGLRALLSGGLGLGYAAPLLPTDADRRAELDQVGVCCRREWRLFPALHANADRMQLALQLASRMAFEHNHAPGLLKPPSYPPPVPLH